jgi:hypothetical protein
MEIFAQSASLAHIGSLMLAFELIKLCTLDHHHEKPSIARENAVFTARKCSNDIDE